jgi:hypothetical protein
MDIYRQKHNLLFRRMGGPKLRQMQTNKDTNFLLRTCSIFFLQPPVAKKSMNARFLAT